MKRILFILALLLLTIIGYCYSNETKNPLVLTKITELENRLNLLQSKNDSLNKQIIIYKVKEDFYACALSDQSTKYSLITGSLLALLALISYASFKYEINKIKKDFELKICKHVETDKKIIDKHNEGLARSYVNGGNSNQIVKESLENKNDLIGASYYNLFATYNHYLASKEFLNSNAEDNVRIAESEMKLVKNLLGETLDIIERLNSDNSYSHEQSLNFRKWLDKMAMSNDESIKDLIAKLRVNMVKRTSIIG